MIAGRDVVLISSIDWKDVWQVPQEIALRLARAGNRVLFVENTGVRVPRASDLSRVRLRLLRWMRAWRAGGLGPHSEGVYISSPVVLPPFGPVLRRRINRHLLLPGIARAARRLGMRDPLLWTFLPTDSALEIIRSLRGGGSAVIYYCAADFRLLTPYADDLAHCEQEILRQCDVVFATCSALTNHCAKWNQNVHACPHGVDLAAFPTEEISSGTAVAGDAVESYRRMLPSLPRPIIGFIGGLHRFVDFRLTVEMARARPNWTWVFVGPGECSSSGLARLPNVRMLGRQPHEDLVHYLRTFDLGIVPYLKNAYTRTILPVKINEYLAAGKPVVSTDLEPVVEFNSVHEVLITSDNQPGSFLEAIERALGTAADPASVSRRRAVAAQYDWNARLERMCAVIEKRIHS